MHTISFVGGLSAGQSAESPEGPAEIPAGKMKFPFHGKFRLSAEPPRNVRSGETLGGNFPLPTERFRGPSRSFRGNVGTFRGIFRNFRGMFQFPPKVENVLVVVKAIVYLSQRVFLRVLQ